MAIKLLVGIEAEVRRVDLKNRQIMRRGATHACSLFGKNGAVLTTAAFALQIRSLPDRAMRRTEPVG
jgi:hypothetical protein